MAVYGTVNDLSMAGAKPLYLSVSFILEEGLSMEVLWRVVQSIQRAAAQAAVQVVTGDTKVVDRGKGDGLYINTAGVGVIDHPWTIGAQSVQSGDAILLSGDIGRHGIAIMAQREGLTFETTLESDLAPVSAPVQALLNAEIEIHCLRDLTRGGLATALNEIAIAAQLNLQLDATIAVTAAVQGACEILGFDPLYLANEGRFIAFVPAAQAETALAILRAHGGGLALPAQQIGIVESRTAPADGSSIGGVVKQYTGWGGNRVLDYRNVDQLPRIC
jgi:hydrogenase expression/formation protein HypE